MRSNAIYSIFVRWFCQNRRNYSNGEVRTIIEKFSTKELVEELKKREGVRTEYAEPYRDKNLSINGPAVILVIID